uniref:CUB domain-containing protein n=1 Tax=Timema douglasi TaxID=61478 RepID=A0A7R8VLC1_TIMDO|nr:unnamed protein product [Timema douglasi]
MLIAKVTSDHKMGPLWMILLSTPLIISACFLPEELLSSNNEKMISLPEINSTYDACTNSIHNLDVDSKVVTRDGDTNSINNLDGEHKFLDIENDPNINPILVSEMKYKAVTQDENANITQIHRSDMKSKSLIIVEDTDIPKHYSNMTSRDVLQGWEASTPPIEKSPVKSRGVLQGWEVNTPPIQKSPVKSRDVLQGWEANTPPIQKSPVKSRAVPLVWNELAESNCSQVLYVGSSQQVEFYFPSSYPRNSYCIVILRGPMEHKLVLMLMDTRTGDHLISCDQDAVHVYSLNQGLLTFKDQLCNGSSPGVVTDGNIALLTFNTVRESTRGFNVNLQIVSNSAVDNTNNQYQHGHSSFSPHPVEETRLSKEQTGEFAPGPQLPGTPDSPTHFLFTVASLAIATTHVLKVLYLHLLKPDPYSLWAVQFLGQFPGHCKVMARLNSELHNVCSTLKGESPLLAREKIYELIKAQWGAFLGTHPVDRQRSGHFQNQLTIALENWVVNCLHEVLFPLVCAHYQLEDEHILTRAIDLASAGVTADQLGAPQHFAVPLPAALVCFGSLDPRRSFSIRLWAQARNRDVKFMEDVKSRLIASPQMDQDIDMRGEDSTQARRFVDIDLPPTCHAEYKPIICYEDGEDEVFFGFDNTVEAYVPSPDGSGEDGDISFTPDDTVPNIDVVELASLDTLTCPVDKLTCLHTVVDLIFAQIKAAIGDAHCTDDTFITEENHFPTMTTDDLIPLLITVIIQAKPIHAASNLFYVENFQWTLSPNDAVRQTNNLKKLFSFSLVTFKAALQELLQLNPDHLRPRNEKVLHELGIDDLIEVSSKVCERLSRYGSTQAWSPLDKHLQRTIAMIEASTLEADLPTHSSTSNLEKTQFR